jgi:hypothetical protein
MIRMSEEHPAPPRSSLDDVLDVYKRDLDLTLLREALKLTPDQRVRKMIELLRFSERLREAGKKAFG